jgi:hypothetical protein
MYPNTVYYIKLSIHSSNVQKLESNSGMLKGTSSLPSLDPVPKGSKKKKKLYTSKSSADFTPLPDITKTRRVKKQKVKLPVLNSPPKGCDSPKVSKKISTKKIRSGGIGLSTTSKKQVSKLTRLAEHLGDIGNKDSHEVLQI